MLRLVDIVTPPTIYTTISAKTRINQLYLPTAISINVLVRQCYHKILRNYIRMAIIARACKSDISHANNYRCVLQYRNRQSLTEYYQAFGRVGTAC